MHLVGCGTAMHAGMVGKTAIEALARVPAQVDIASEFRYRDPILKPEDLVIIISQSGETSDTLAALKLAKSRGVRVLAIVNVVRAFGLRAFGSSIWIAVLAAAVAVGIGGVLIVVNPWGASMTFVLVLGATFVANGAVDLFIEWYTRDSEKKVGTFMRR